MRIRALLASVTVAALLAAPVAAQDSCITEDQLGALVIYSVPLGLSAIRERCAAQLPAGSFMATGAVQAQARYERLADRHWPDARDAFFQFAGNDREFDPAERKRMRGMADGELRTSLAQYIQNAIIQSIPDRDCAGIDRLIASLAPLEPAQAAEIVVSIAAMASLANPSICRAEPR